MDGIINKPLDSVTNPTAGVYKLGPLIIQVMSITVPWRKVTAFNYNQAFPNGVIAVFGQGTHIGEVGSNSIYSSPISLQVDRLSNSQYKCAVSSAVTDAAMGATIVAIGY